MGKFLEGIFDERFSFDGAENIQPGNNQNSVEKALDSSPEKVVGILDKTDSLKCE
ncbi:MAG: hypothetical protein PHS92_05355 [Candidatus Gracilibacteria bacterium]|nr:hypothetical protein [Candidatus Gracilibacteria bacterium]